VQNTGALIGYLFTQGGPQIVISLFKFCDNFHKYTPIFTIFSLLEQEMYDAYYPGLTFIM